jgi:hypothetical protein
VKFVFQTRTTRKKLILFSSTTATEVGLRSSGLESSLKIGSLKVGQTKLEINTGFYINNKDHGNKIFF